VVSARIGLDTVSGIYVDGSATVVLTKDDDLRFLGYQVDAGIAKHVGDLGSIDVGIAHNQLRAPYSGGFSYTYTEGYLGVNRRPISAYVFISPNYFRHDVWTVYGQIEATATPARDWRLTAHVGSLNYLHTPVAYTVRHKTHYDWRLGVAREFGNLEVHAALSGGGPGREYYYGKSHSRTALTAGASVSF